MLGNMMANILVGLAQVLAFVLQLYTWILIGRAIISWVNADPRNAIVRFLRSVTDPPVEMIRRRLPRNLRYFPLDIAFLVLFGLVIFAQYAVVQTLIDFGQQLRSPVRAGPVLSARPGRATLWPVAMTSKSP
jgi:YggT family protein